MFRFELHHKILFGTELMSGIFQLIHGLSLLVVGLHIKLRLTASKGVHVVYRIPR